MNTELEKIEFLMQLLKDQEFKMDLARAHALVVSYKWLLDKHAEAKKDAN